MSDLNLSNNDNSVDTSNNIPLLEEDVNKITQNMLANADLDESVASVLAQTQAFNNKEQNRVLRQQIAKMEQDAHKRELVNQQNQQKLEEARYYDAIIRDISKVIPDITKPEDFINKINENGDFMADIAKAAHFPAFVQAVNKKDAQETLRIIKDTFKKKQEELMSQAEIGGSNITVSTNNKPQTNTKFKFDNPENIKRSADELVKQYTKDGKLDRVGYREALLDLYTS